MSKKGPRYTKPPSGPLTSIVLGSLLHSNAISSPLTSLTMRAQAYPSVEGLSALGIVATGARPQATGVARGLNRLSPRGDTAEIRNRSPKRERLFSTGPRGLLPLCLPVRAEYSPHEKTLCPPKHYAYATKTKGSKPIPTQRIKPSRRQDYSRSASSDQARATHGPNLSDSHTAGPQAAGSSPSGHFDASIPPAYFMHRRLNNSRTLDRACE